MRKGKEIGIVPTISARRRGICTWSLLCGRRRTFGLTLYEHGRARRMGDFAGARNNILFLFHEPKVDVRRPKFHLE